MSLDVYIDPDTNDIVINESQDVTLIDGEDELAQYASTLLQTRRGTVLLDDDWGIPYRDVIFVRNPNISRIGSTLRSKLLGLSQVIAVPKLEMRLDVVTRELTVDFEIETTEGLVSGSEVI
jgi:hypothetical protein